MANRTDRADRDRSSSPASAVSPMLEVLEPRLLLSASLPGLHLVDPTVDQFDGQVIYLDFDGEEDVTYNGPVTVENIDVPAFAAPGDLAGQEQPIIAQVLDRLGDTFADTGLIFTTERPATTQSYSSVYVGGDDAAFAAYGGFVSLAEQVDVANGNMSDEALIFSDQVGYDGTQADYVLNLAESIAHETGHLLGYAHDAEYGAGGILSEVAAASGYIVSVTQPTYVGGRSSSVTVKVKNTSSTQDFIIDYGSKPSGWSISPGSFNPDINSNWYYYANFTVTPPTSGGSGTIVWQFKEDGFWSNPILDTYNDWVSAAASKPDLIVQDISVSSPRVAGQSATITATLKNQGNADANGSIQLKYYVDGSYIGYDNMSWGLDAGDSDTESISYTASSSGSHSVRVYVDSSYIVSESNESNNSRTESFTWSSPPKPDLIVKDISISPSSPTAGQSATITATLKNQGDAKANGSIRLKYYVDGGYIGDDYLSYGLGAGSSNNESISYTYAGSSGGNHTVKVIIDTENIVSESNESNNERSETYYWNPAPRPDLIVQDISINPSSPTATQPATITATLKNQGNASASGSIRLMYYVDGGYIGDDYLSLGLGAGSSNNESISYTASSTGNHTVKVIVDTQNIVSESNEGNNERSETYYWNPVPKPDLVISDIAMSDSTVYAGQSISLDFWGNNITPGTTSVSNVQMKAYWGTSQSSKSNYIGTEYFGEFNGLSYNENEKTTIFSWSVPTLSPGTYWITAEIDTDNKQDNATTENDANNIRSESFTILPPADLVISDIAMSDSTVYAGDSVSLDFWGNNITPGTTSVSNVQMKAYWGTSQNSKSNYIGTEYFGEFNGLSYNENEKTTIFSWSIPTLSPGTYWITAEIDTDNKQDNATTENDANNIRSESFTVLETPKPDLRVISLTASSTTVIPGDDIEIDAIVKNFDLGDAPKSQIGYWWGSTQGSREVFIGEGDIPNTGVLGYLDESADSPTVWPLEPNFVIPDVAPGTYYLTAVADYKGPHAYKTVDESDEDNNELSIPITVESGVSTIDGISRWWAYASEQFSVDVDITAGPSGQYKLDIDIEGLFNDFDLTSTAYLTVDSSPSQYTFNTLGVATIPSLSSGAHTLHINRFEAPDHYVVEGVAFQLDGPGSSDDDLNAMFVSERPGLASLSGLAFEDGFGSSLPVSSIQDLANAFSPMIFLEDGEHYKPVSVESIWGAGTINALGQNPNTDVPLDLPGTSPAEYFSTYYSEPADTTVYASLVPDLGNDQLALNYWFYYPYSNWGEHGGLNNHESDWEGYTVYFDEVSSDIYAPTSITTAQHLSGEWATWTPAITGGATHPYVYPGLGGHATYLLSGVTYPDSVHPEYHSGSSGIQPIDNVIYLDRASGMATGSTSWALFPGRWGQMNLDGWIGIPGDDGPRGPVFQGDGQRWADPWTWTTGFAEVPSARFRGDHFVGKSATVGTPVLLEAKLEADTAGHVDIAGEPIQFEIYAGGSWQPISDDGISNTALVTDANGIARVYYLVPEAFSSGAYPIRAAFGGNSQYLGTTAEATLTVEEAQWSVPEIHTHNGVGSGIPIVLVHGNGSETETGSVFRWQTFLDQYDSHPEVYAPFDVFVWKHDTSRAIGFNGTTGNAADLADFIYNDLLVNRGYAPNTKVLFVAHSRGGLVARSFMNYGNQGDDILGLVTLGTPHHGSPAAIPDWNAAIWGRNVGTDPEDLLTFSLLVGPEGKGFDTDRLGSLNLAWDNLDGAVSGTTTTTFGLPFFPMGTSYLTSRDTNIANSYTDPTVFYSDSYKALFATLSELNTNESQAVKDKIVTFAAYDENILLNNLPWSSFYGTLLNLVGAASSDHVALSGLTSLMANSSSGIVSNGANYYANDGMVPLQSALYLDTSGGTAFASKDILGNVILDNGNIVGKTQVRASHVFSGDNGIRDHLDLLDTTNQAYWNILAAEIHGLAGSSAPPAVVGHKVFYNNSSLDGNTSGASPLDDGAIAGDKQALMPGEMATGANCTAYSKGLNGIMVDIDGLIGTPDTGDFLFKVGNDDNPDGWAAAPAPTSITVRPGAGVAGSDRVTIIWADNAIQKEWLQVTVLSDANGGSLGLADDDVFSFGNMPGDATGDGVTNGFDLLRVRQNYLMPPGGGRDDTADVTMDDNVNGFDLLAVRQNYLESIPMISPPAAAAAAMVSMAELAVEPLETMAAAPVSTQIAPAVEQVRVETVSPLSAAATTISAVFDRYVSVAPAALEITARSGPKLDLSASVFRYEPATRTASWTMPSLANGYYEGVIRANAVTSVDSVSLTRDYGFRFRLLDGRINDLQQDINGDGIIDLLDLIAV